MEATLGHCQGHAKGCGWPQRAGAEHHTSGFVVSMAMFEHTETQEVQGSPGADGLAWLRIEDTGEAGCLLL